MLSYRMMRSLIRKSHASNYSARELASIANNDFNLLISVLRIQQIISEITDMKYFKMLKTPRMIPENKENRPNTSLIYINKVQDSWNIVELSNEKRFCFGRPEVSAYYWADTILKRKYFSTRSHGGRGLKVLAGISKRGETELLFVDGNLKAQEINAMLSNYLVRFIEDKYDGEDD